ncbi:MAG: SDR family NAD(P)-dependent oxidoreductase, partial [Nonlabens ulvanivorans]
RPGSLTNDSLTNHITLEKSLSKRGEISRNDVAMTLTTCLTDHLASNQTFEIINGDTLINEALDNISATHA